MKKNLLERAKEKTILFDGAMGTMLMAAGLSPGETPELWNLEKPSQVRDIHRQYYEAGSDVVHTNTFGGNPLKLADKDLAQKTEKINREAAKLARSVCPSDKYVAGDIGPTGKMLQPLGEVTLEQWKEAFLAQAKGLLEEGIDLFSIETMFSLEEALAAVEVVKSLGDIPVSASLTYNRTKNGFFTMMGEGVGQCVTALENAGVDVIATNCTLGSGDMLDLTRELRALTHKPIFIQPNAGKPVSRKGVTHYEQTPSEFASDMMGIIEAGADMIGGCCGTNPEFIREVSRRLKAG